jgi:hypothetical protein
MTKINSSFGFNANNLILTVLSISSNSQDTLFNFNGSNDFMGLQGFQGSNGIQGFQGSEGFQGFQGVQGNQGNQGFIGRQGVQGFQGRQGLQGLQGRQGFQGFQGVQGLQGRQGFQGLPGFQGRQGVQGFQGFTGIQGVQGVFGIQGFQGKMPLYTTSWLYPTIDSIFTSSSQYLNSWTNTLNSSTWLSSSSSEVGVINEIGTYIVSITYCITLSSAGTLVLEAMMGSATEIYALSSLTGTSGATVTDNVCFTQVVDTVPFYINIYKSGPAGTYINQYGASLQGYSRTILRVTKVN